MFPIFSYKNQIEKLCVSLRIKRLDLVGSAARTDFDPDRSDIDVLVEFVGGDKLFDRYFELKTRLEESFGRPVDVIQKDALKNSYVNKSMNRTRIPVYGP